MKTNHKIVFGNSKNMKEILPESVNFVVTSPPYPMIEMWDGQFSYINPEIKEALQNEEGVKAYNLMNEELNKTWIEIDRVLSPGGIVCINIGDATRKIGDSFQLYPNHSRITHYFEKMNYQVL
ncbi:MAG: DNA methyltransferase, partial [Methanobacterium sp.]